MGYTPQKKALKKQKTASSPLDGVKSGWEQKKPVVFFVLGFVVLMILFYIFWLSDFAQEGLQKSIVHINAKLASTFLNIFGMQTKAVNEILSSPAYSISIARGCDAIEAMALFASALLAFPSGWIRKIAGLLIGLLILFSLNILRIVSLFLTGIHYPKAFEFMHVEFWQVAFILFAVGLWI
ncbi:MAG TPA: archaeosortase/exosortase family protein, partial [Bacteroidales bacterium]|nr:archaeosortase/exosortase family protein [Bacteroidales bacterium]